MANQCSSVVVGCLLDVSGSMRNALEVGRSDEGETERLRAVLRATLKVARAEHKKSPDTLMFVGVFGLNEGTRCPPVVDLCGVVDALLDIRSDNRSGHDLLVALAGRHDRAYIERYIRNKLTDDEARIVYRHLQRHEECIPEFVDAIPTEEQNRQARGWLAQIGAFFGSVTGAGAGAVVGSVAAPFLGPAGVPIAVAVGAGAVGTGGVMAADRAADAIEDNRVDNSEAMKLARDIWDEWWQGFANLEPRSVADVINLLERLQEHSNTASAEDGEEQFNSEDQVNSEEQVVGEEQATNEEQGAEDRGDPIVLDTLRRYMYGRTPLKKALRRAIKAFRESRQPETTQQRVLILISDGYSTDGNPVDLAKELTEADDEKEKVTLAVIHLTSNSTTPRRRLYDSEAKDWDQGQRTLFQMASRAAGDVHPVPVLASMGWKIPSSGEFALYTTVCSVAALDEFCLLLLSARFGSADTLLDLVGRANLDAYINDEHIRTRRDPTDQGNSATCYAHATAAVLHMALSRVVGREGGHPDIKEIRKRILKEFPPTDHGRSVEEVLEKATDPTWYRPLLFRKVDVMGARHAVLRRRPVLTTFYLSEPGWECFSRHFEAEVTAKSVLTRQDMPVQTSDASGGGHAVVLTGCGPRSLTFLNSWGRNWGDKGKFSIEDHTILESPGAPMCFYDVYWLERDLTESERKAFDTKADEAIRSHAAKWPSIFDFEALCPRCDKTAAIAKFTGSIRKAICPNCRQSFTPEPGHLVQALYMRAGLGDAP